MPYYTCSSIAPLGVNAKLWKKYGYQVEACQGVWEAGSECHGSDDGFFNLGNIQPPKEQEKVVQRLTPVGLPSLGLSCEMGPPGIFPKYTLLLNLTTSLKSPE